MQITDSLLYILRETKSIKHYIQLREPLCCLQLMLSSGRSHRCECFGGFASPRRTADRQRELGGNASRDRKIKNNGAKEIKILGPRMIIEKISIGCVENESSAWYFIRQKNFQG